MQQFHSSAEMMLRLLEGFIWFDQQLQTHLANHNMPTVNRTESMIMLLIGAGLTRPTVLAEKLGLARQTINSAIRNLEAKSLVRLTEDPEDRRCKILEPAAEGMKIHVVALDGLAQAEASLSQRIGSKRMIELKAALTDCWG